VPAEPSPRRLLELAFTTVCQAAAPYLCLPPALAGLQRRPAVVLGAGKAAASMAAAFHAHWGAPVRGMVVTRYEHGLLPGEQCGGIEVVEAGHPSPDDASLAAGARLLSLAAGVGRDETLICLISGGGSSLASQPLPVLTFEQKRAAANFLIRQGADIREINCVRKHLSLLKGGRLAVAAHPAPVATFVISDVPGDDPVDIASGPTVADASTSADALAVLRRYRIDVPARALDLLESGAGESLKPGDPRLPDIETRFIATPQMALEAAAQIARDAGYDVHVLGDAIEGEARDVAKAMAGIALQVARRGQPFKAPCVLLSGGETTVTVRGSGRGGRNVEFLLSLGIALDGEPGVHAMAGDTDGVDGQEEIAGAFLAPDTLARAWARGIHPRERLDDNDGHGFFGALGDAVVTGPTLTNVNDFRAILIDGRQRSQ